MWRHCDGQDPDLTREIEPWSYDPETETVSPWDDIHGDDYTMIINCACGASFDDNTRRLDYPHRRIRRIHPIDTGGLT